MIDPKREKEIKTNIHYGIIKAIDQNTTNDEEWLSALIWAQNYISDSLLKAYEKLQKNT